MLIKLLSTAAVSALMLSSLPASAQDTGSKKSVLTQEEKDQLILVPEEEVRELRRIAREMQQARRGPIAAPNLRTTREMLNLEPGSQIPTLSISERYTTNLVFTDITGQRWPVQSARTSQEADFDIVAGDEAPDGDPAKDASHTVYIAPKHVYGHGNLIVKLVGLPKPFSIIMSYSDKAVDLEKEYIVPGSGPNAIIPPTGVVMSATRTDPSLSQFMTMTPPAGAKFLSVDPAYFRDVRAWSLNGAMFVRTRHSLLGPGFAQLSFGSGAPGEEMKVYKLHSLEPLLNLSIGGEAQFVRVEY